MSDLSASPTDAVEASAASWIRRKEFGEWSDAVEHEFQEWLSQSVLHRVAFLRLDEGWNRTRRLAALKPPSQQPAPRTRFTLPWKGLLRIASVVFAIGVLGVGVRAYLASTSQETYTTPVGGREVITLFDDSHVELNTDTILRLSKQRRRAVLVKGEAFFQVHHDAKNPFVVIASGQRITDLGTQFSVKDRAGAVKISLLEGRARIESTDASVRPAVLSPGDVAIATAGKLSVAHEPLQALTNDVGWRRGVLIFRHTALADVAAEFNRYNAKKIVIDPKVARVTIDGTFDTDNIETFARVTRVALGLHVESLEQEIVISR